MVAEQAKSDCVFTIAEEIWYIQQLRFLFYCRKKSSINDPKIVVSPTTTNHDNETDQDDDEKQEDWV